MKSFALLLFLSFVIVNNISAHVAPPKDTLSTRWEMHPSTRQNFQEYTLTELKEVVNKQSLPVNERLKILRSAAKVLSEYNPNTFLHLNYLGKDARQQLEDLEKSVDTLSNFEFHTSVIQVFSSLDDLHTVYLPPQPLLSAEVSSVGPFSTYFEIGDDVPKYFVPGTDLHILQVDNRPVHEEAKRLGKAAYASNEAAQLSYGLEALTTRRLLFDYIPTKDSVNFTILDGNDVSTSAYMWKYFGLTAAASDNANRAEGNTALFGKRLQSGPQKVQVAPVEILRKQEEKTPSIQNARITTRSLRQGVTRTQIQLDRNVAGFLEAELVETKSGTVGYVRLFSFLPDTDNGFNAIVDEFRRLLSKVLPKNRVVIDIRDNPGGYIDLAKYIFDLLHTNKNLPPQILVSRASQTTLSMYSQKNLVRSARTEADLYLAAVEDAVKFGEQFTGPIAPLYSLEDAYEGFSDIPRLSAAYDGQFVVLTSARSFSSSDLFAAWTQDAGVGVVVGVDERTGGGGASIVYYEESLRARYAETFGERLADGVDFTTASIRFFRSGVRGGRVLENFGVKAGVRYFYTKKDREEQDSDLLEFLGDLLKSRST